MTAPSNEAGATRHAELLARGERSACVWGLGHIGAETVRRLAAAGLRVVGYDVDPERARAVASAAGVRGTTSRDEALDPDVVAHFVAVPTERSGRPFLGAVVDVLGSIAASVADGRDPPVVVVIESTVTPGTTEDVLLPLCEANGAVAGEDILLVLAPRRDWLVAPSQHQTRVGRVYGGIDARSVLAGGAILSLLQDDLHPASSHRVAELVKCAENAIRHVQIMLGNQLSLAYPDVDVAEALELAGTKWNVEVVHPSFGTGGYCVPLSSKYLLAGATDPRALSILDDALATEERLRRLVVERVAQRERVAILGLTYRTGVKVATLSPALALAAALRELGTPHSVHDPLYSAAEIAALCPGTLPAKLEEGIRAADAVLVVTGHPEFLEPAVRDALRAPADSGRLVLDSPGLMAGQTWPEWVEYHRAGHAGWLGSQASARHG
jgi:nucleotide sugar dehydrogenase